MKILIIGGSGFVGYELVKFFKKDSHDVEFTYNRNKIESKKSHFLDITIQQDSEKIIKKVNPDVVFHTAALTNVDTCEDNKELANSINVNGTANIIKACKNTKSKVVFISSSFVFNGKREKYFEDDHICPNTHYGQTKAKAEELVKNSGLSYQILRTDQPYGWTEKWHHPNSVTRCLSTLMAKNQLKEVKDWFNMPTYLPDFVRAVKHLSNGNKQGIFHLTGSDYISRLDWSMKTAEIFGFDKGMINPIHSSDLKLSASRPNVNMSNEKIFDKTGIKMMGVMEGLKR